MRILGRSLQQLGLVSLPLSMFLNLVDVLDTKKMLTMAVAGFALFWIGRIVEGYATAPDSKERTVP